MSREYFQFLRDLEKQNGLPAGLLSVQQQAESNFDPRAVSPAGAQGIAQFMPATAAEYGIDPFDPMQSAQAQAKMMGGLLKKYQGDVPSALAGYNWGQGNVDRKGLDNAPAETRKYIAKITSGLQSPQTITADASIATPVQNMVALDGNTDPVPDMSDEELQAIADQGKNQDLLKQAEGLSDAQLEAIAKGGSDDMSDLLRAPGELVKGIGEGAVRMAGGATTGFTKAIAQAAQSTRIAPEWGAAQEKEISDFQRKFNADAPDITQANSVGDASRWLGNLAGYAPAYMYAAPFMIAQGVFGGAADAAEKTKGNPLATVAGGVIDGALNAIPGKVLGAEKGRIISALGASALGLATPDIRQIPERLAGQTPAPITDNERINAGLSGAVMGAAFGGKKAEGQLPSKSDVEQGMTAAYKAVDNSGVVLKPDSANRLHDAIKLTVPKTPVEQAAALKSPDHMLAKQFEGMRDNPVTLTDAVTIDKQMTQAWRDAKRAGDKVGARTINLAQENFRNVMQKEFGALPEHQALKDAMAMASANFKMEKVQRIIEDAADRDNPHVWMRNQFQALRRDAKKFGGWSKQELAALNKASKFDTSDNLLRFMGGRLFPYAMAGAGLASAGLGGLAAGVASSAASGAFRGVASSRMTAKGNRVSKAIAKTVTPQVNRALNPPAVAAPAAQTPLQARLARVGTAPAPAAPAPAAKAPAGTSINSAIAATQAAVAAKKATPFAPQAPTVGSTKAAFKRLEARLAKAGQLELEPKAAKSVKKPQTLADFVRKNGGLKDTGGDIKAFVGKNKSALLRPNTGKKIDEMALKAWEEGYFPEKGDERPSVNEFLDKLSEDVNGKPQYSDKDADAVMRYEESGKAVSDIDTLAIRFKIDTNGKSDSQIVNEAKDIMSQEEALQLQIEIGEAQGYDLDAAKRAESGEFDIEVPDEGRLGD